MGLGSNQPQLFDAVESVPLAGPTENPRQGFIDAAARNADIAFKQKYTALLMEFVRSGKEFIGEMVQDEYRKRRLPEPRNWRAVGAMYQRLVRNGVIVRVGYGKRNQGNITAAYKGK